MNKEKNILKNYLLYFSTLLLICIIGISNVFALTYENAEGYKNDITIVLVAPDYSDTPINVPINSGYALAQVREVIIQLNNFNFVANRNYQLEMYLPQQDLGRANFYTVQGANGESCLISYDNSAFDGEYPRWAFQCPNSTNNITIDIKNSNNQILWDIGPNGAPIFTWGYSYLRYSSTSLSGSGIGTDDIINNQNQNTQNIINNQNQNTQDIINNQNQNTQQQIESQKVCKSIDIDKNTTGVNGYLDNSGSVISYSTYITTDYIELFSQSKIKILNTYSSSDYRRLCFYNDSKVNLSCIVANTLSDGDEVSIPNNAKYVRFTIRIYDNLPTYNILNCINGNQALSDDNKEAEKTRKGILGKLKDLFDTLFSNDDADISGLNNMVGWLPPGPVDAIINLPLSFFNALTNTLTGTCVSVSLTIPYVNKTLVLPCFDAYMSQYLTNFNTFWTLVGFIGSVFILYHYLLALYKWIDDTLTLRENNLPGYYDDNWGGGA